MMGLLIIVGRKTYSLHEYVGSVSFIFKYFKGGDGGYRLSCGVLGFRTSVYYILVAPMPFVTMQSIYYCNTAIL